MDHRGDILRVEPTVDRNRVPPQASLLDWAQPSLDDYQLLDLVPAIPSSSSETKEERNFRLLELRQYSDKWKEEAGTPSIVEHWKRSLLSEFSLSEEQIILSSGINDIHTLYLEFYWRLLFFGPRDALTLLGAPSPRKATRPYLRQVQNLPKKPSRRTYTRQRGKRLRDSGGENNRNSVVPKRLKNSMMSQSYYPHRKIRGHSERPHKRMRIEDTRGHHPRRQPQSRYYGLSGPFPRPNPPTRTPGAPPSQLPIYQRSVPLPGRHENVKQVPAAAPTLALDQYHGPGHLGLTDRPASDSFVHGGCKPAVPVHKLPSPLDSQPQSKFKQKKAQNESEHAEKEQSHEDLAWRREQDRLAAEEGISRFIHAPVPMANVDMSPSLLPGKRPSQSLASLKFSKNKKRRTQSPENVQAFDNLPPPSQPSGCSSPDSSTTMGDTVGTASTLFSEEEKTELLEDGPKKLGPPRDERQPSESSPKFSENMVTLILPTEWDLPVNLAPSLNDAGLANKVSNEVKTARPQPLDLDLDLDLDLEAMQMVKPEDLELVVIPSAHEHRRPPMAGATVAPAIVPENIAPEPDLPPFRPLIPLNTYPPIWAQTRQEVCETFEWFRSYQGGVYFNNDIAKGYLLSAFGARRDAFKHDGRLIISHGGGRAASIHSEKGQSSLRPAEDQKSDDKSVRALLKACREKRPIALVIDDRYALFPYDLSALGVTYAVLGFYMIVEAWAEYETDRTGARSVVKYKFAFQWCERQGEPWWLSQSGKAEELDLDEDAPPVKVGEVDDLREEEDSDPTDVTSTECDQCGKGSPQVYSEGWVCLQPTCPMFWKVFTGDEEQPFSYLPEKLNYREDFLKLRAACPLPIGFETLKPPLPKKRDDGVTTSQAHTRGFHCQKCGRLSCRLFSPCPVPHCVEKLTGDPYSRVEWQRWKCNTVGCESVYSVPARVREPKEFWSQPTSSKFTSAEIDPSSGVKRLRLPPLFDDNLYPIATVDGFLLPHNRGCLYQIQPSSRRAKLEADNIFKTYQEEANSGQLVFKRWPLRAVAERFSPTISRTMLENLTMSYVGGTDNTVPFDKAPSAVVMSRKLIQDRISQALDRDTEFNEVLTAAYMEKQKMAFHSDEEVGLGPLVAGLSLGSPAMMHFRLQKKHDKERQQRGILMSFTLRHGDVFVMDGLDVQKYYEHTVVPTNFRIAATARSINASTAATPTEPALSGPHKSHT